MSWIVFATTIVLLRYAVLPQVDAYRSDIEAMASSVLGESVRIGAIEASWRGLRPSLALREVRIVDRNGQNALELPSVRATLSWESVVVMQLRLASLEIDRPELVVRRDVQGEIYVAGLAMRASGSNDNRLGEWLLAQDEIRIRHAALTWRDEMQSEPATPDTAVHELALTDVDFVLRRSGWRHRFALRATPPEDLGPPLDLRAVIDHPIFSTRLADPATWSGEVYADLASGEVTAWRRHLTMPTATLEAIDSGRGRARTWMRFTSVADALEPAAVSSAINADGASAALFGRVAEITADLAFDDLAVHWGAGTHAALDSLDGRIVATQSARSQELRLVKLAMRPHEGVALGATDLVFERRQPGRPDESGTAATSAIDIGTVIGLVPAALLPADINARIAALHPRGRLDGVAVRWTGPLLAPATFRFDARFDGFSLAAQPPSDEAIRTAAHEIVGPDGHPYKPHPPFGQPGFDNLAGTLSASRTRDGDAPPLTVATITIKAVDATIRTPGLFDDPVLHLARLAAQVDVRFDGADLAVKVEQVEVENADLAGTADVVFKRGPHSGSDARGWLDVDAHLTRADIVRVPRYLPNTINDRVRSYLSRSLLAGQATDTSFRIHGSLEQLNLRSQSLGETTAYPATLEQALAAVRDGGAGGSRGPPRNGKAAGSGKDEPIFHIVVKVQGATFLYGPGRSAEEVAAATGVPVAAATPVVPWPAFEDLDGEIVFDHADMVINAQSTRVFGFKLTDVRAELPALSDPAHVLRVVGKGSGPLQDLVRLVNSSPIGQWTRRAADGAVGNGDAKLALALDLPLSHMQDAAVAGSVQLANNDLVLNPLAPVLKRLSGRVDFTDRSLTIAGLAGQTLGGPLRVDANTRNDGSIEIDAAGTLDARSLRGTDVVSDESDATLAATARTVQRVAERLDGSTRYTAAFRIRNRRQAETSTTSVARPDVVIESNLTGLAIDLPAPFNKAATDNWPLRVEITRVAPNTTATATADGDDVRITLADRLSASVSRRRDAQGQLAVTRAAYGVGSDGGTPKVERGATTVSVSLPTLDLDAWRDVANQLAPAAKPSRAPAAGAAGLEALIPARVILKTGTLRVAGRTLDNLSFDIERIASGWPGDLNADQIAGHLAYNDAAGPAPGRAGSDLASSGRLVARLSHLSIPKSDSGGAEVDTALDASKQKDFPAIDLVADRFDLRGRSLGRLEVVAENVGDEHGREWRLEKLGLTAPEARFAAHGVWSHTGSSEKTRLTFELDATDVGALLDRLGIGKTIKDGAANLSGDIGWDGGPTSIDYGSMQGHVKLDARKGQFLKADPGIAKLLGVLSLQSLPRRFLLDFSDVFAEGFAFDAVHADAAIDKGIATTDNFKMLGVQATVMMSGNADLERETQNLHVLVLPEINAGAASLGYAIVNPAIGLATFAAQYLFKDPIARALSFEYNVTGPWSKPSVVKIDHAFLPAGKPAEAAAAAPVEHRAQ